MSRHAHDGGYRVEGAASRFAADFLEDFVRANFFHCQCQREHFRYQAACFAERSRRRSRCSGNGSKILISC
ncbi:MAG: hypothetical protein ACHQWV_05965, partial [Nitrospirales bacterium]